jgi:hypothetical protein
MSARPIDVVGRWLPNLLDPDIAASFRKDDAWTVHTEAGAEPFEVPR